MANQDVKIDNESLIEILNLIKQNITEERNLALERFKRQDDMIDSNEQFYLQGRILAEYLRAASDRTDALFNIAKLQAGILYKNASENASSGLNADEIQKEIQKLINGDSSNSTTN